MIIILLKKSKFITIILLILFSCSKSPNNPPSEIDWSNYRGYLSASDFKEAIIGKWRSVYQKEGYENIKYLEINSYEDAKIIIKNGARVEVEGKYKIHFLRPPTKEMVTFAEMTIKSDNVEIKLSQMNFGYHNALPFELGPFLRVDKSPYGVLTKLTE